MPAIGLFDTGIFDTGIFDHSAEAVTVFAPSYGHWRKTRSNRQKNLSLPTPAISNEVRIDDAVLRQMAEERRAARVLTAKQDALKAMSEARMRAGVPFKEIPVAVPKTEPVKNKIKMSLADIMTPRMRFAE